MSRIQHIQWADVLDLRVIHALARLIHQRWRLAVAFHDDDGSVVEESLDALPARSGACALLETAGAGPCEATARALRKLHRRGGADFASVTHTCEAGLTEVAAPIHIAGGPRGFVVVGGYLTADNGDRSRLRQQLAAAGAAAETLDRVLAEVPVLGVADEGHLRALVELLAQEVARFQGESQVGERRFDARVRTTRYSYDDIIGLSRPMLELYELLDKVIDSDSTVLIHGENGTGKELIAKAIHFNSWRKERRFVVQNCSAFNDNLLDSELFGHKKGAFTGAIADKQGLFEVADGSTFFLDEIGDMSPALQVKLLRVLQEGTFIPVGGTQPKKVDVRIIAATNRDLKKMVEEGEFREDLYYRINVINIRVPPLRERKEDIPPLVDHFLRKQSRGQRGRLKKLSRRATRRLMAHDWPGNIRELENEIERLVVLAGDEKLVGDELLSSRIRQPVLQDSPGDGSAPVGLPDAIQSLERKMIYDVLKRNHWNKTRSAQELHISRRNLIRKVNKYNLDQRRVR